MGTDNLKPKGIVLRYAPCYYVIREWLCNTCILAAYLLCFMNTINSVLVVNRIFLLIKSTRVDLPGIARIKIQENKAQDK